MDYLVIIHMITDNAGLVIAATLSAFLGAHYSRKVLKKSSSRPCGCWSGGL
ncbi:MAG: hypothetical protein RBR38_07345 [Desulfomicrobium apsheronum]|nr:hypothetical protein [Desulfomicrobium apsheronum]